MDSPGPAPTEPMTGTITISLPSPPTQLPTSPGTGIPVGSLYAFAAQPDGCTPGYIQINHADGVVWYIEGQPVNVVQPAVRFTFPAGIQATVYAVPFAGWRIDGDVFGSQSRPFELQVSATVCGNSAR